MKMFSEMLNILNQNKMFITFILFVILVTWTGLAEKIVDMALRQDPPPVLTAPLLHEPYHAQGAFEEVEEFQDAIAEQLPHEEQLPQPPHEEQTRMDLQASFEECELAVIKFFSNDLIGAMNLMKPWQRTSLYHSLGTSIFEFIPAMLTFDNVQINRALAALKKTILMCNEHRKNYTFVESIGTMIKKPNYASYTDLEAHAELCYAEALLLQAAMTIMDGEDLTGLLKGTMKIRNCHTCYKECAKILEKKEWDTEQSKLHFQSGVCLGLATFNVMISLLPPRIISLLEFVGFSGNKSLGLAELEAGSHAPGIRSVLCDLTLLGYHLVMCHFIGAEPDLSLAERILEKQLKVYPGSVWFLIFKGRIEFIRGQFDTAITTYTNTITCQNQWPQFHHLCYWEIMWVNSLKMEWRESASCASKLLEESTWSKTIYNYAKAAMLLQLDNTITASEKQQCNELMRNAALYKQRIAGKSLPMEKFVIKRCLRYQAQGGNLVLPAVELFCLWNMFPILARSDRDMQNLLKLIEATRERVEKENNSWMGAYEADNQALLCYLHGCCLAAMNLPRLALNTFDSVFQFKNLIKEDTFLLPYTLSEMAMCYHQLGDNQRALQLLNDTRKKYSRYSLESRLHFRLHSKLEIVKNSSNIDNTSQLAASS